mgnify:CR=1 FL=1
MSKHDNLWIGFDLGGTKIEGIVLGPDGAELARERVSTPAGDYRATLQVVAALVAKLEADAGGECRVGIGMPGSFSRASGRVRNANSVCLNGQPMQRDLEALLGSYAVPATVYGEVLDVTHPVFSR